MDCNLLEVSIWLLKEVPNYIVDLKNVTYFCDVSWKYLNLFEISDNAGLAVRPLVVAAAE